MEHLKPKNKDLDIKEVKYRTDMELLLERRLLRYKEMVMEIAKEQLEMAIWEIKKNIGVNRHKFILSRGRAQIRRYIARQLVEKLKIMDQEVAKMK